MRASVVLCNESQSCFARFVSLNKSGTYDVLVGALNTLEAFPVLIQLSTKVFQSFERLFLFCLHRLLLCELAIVVDCA